MIDTALQPARSGKERISPVAEPEAIPKKQTTAWDFCVSAFVVILGIVLGVIVAQFIGLLTGWIQFC